MREISSRVGRPDTDLLVDIGGTNSRFSIVNGSGNLRRLHKTRTPPTFSEFCSLLHRVVEDNDIDGAIGGVGIAMGGPLDLENGVASPLNQACWRDVPIAKVAQELGSGPIVIGIDVECAALGEWLARDKGFSHLFYLTISTGVGGCLLVEGAPFRGHSGRHPEIGHHEIPFLFDSRIDVACLCGRKNCMEAAVSGGGLFRAYGKEASLLSPAERITTARHLAAGLQNISVIYQPSIIVVGGSVATGNGGELVQHAARLANEAPNLIPFPPVQASSLDDVGPTLGLRHLIETARAR